MKIFARITLLISIIYILDWSIDLGTSPFALSAFSAIAVISARKLQQLKINYLGATLLVILSYLVLEFLLSLFSGITLPPFNGSLWPANFSEHLRLCAYVFLISLATSYFWFRTSIAVTLESILLITSGIVLFAQHRDFNLLMPKFVSSLAWALGISPIAAFSSLGIAAGALAVLYLFIGTSSEKLARPKYRLSAIAITFTFLAMFILFARLVYFHFSGIASSRLANGVGQETGQGLSPLGFHSALGGTNEPAGLLRLDNDYSKNPFSPMLYLREGALSEFNERELVVAERIYDQDVNNTGPYQPYNNEENINAPNRTEVKQSIYLISDHKLAFAVDFPISITPFKSPNPRRFKAAYKAVSLAPTFSLKELSNYDVGDPSWNEETWAHYLKQHKDTRYKDLAIKLAAGTTTPIQSAEAIAQYLSKTSIYTLSPNHEVTPKDDPVAPYLFGDMRGYCVHFAHATTFMLRALGIPARIGTGYLTDLSQARDGHVLLRMSDRHAWAEVYVRNLGWVPFDTKPEQVESHAETQVDMKLLEELMGMLGPDEEILPKDIAKDEERLVEPAEWTLPNPKWALVFMITFAALFLILKLFLRYGWLLANNNKLKIQRAYIAQASTLTDLGLARKEGETHLEYKTRLANKNINLSFAPYVEQFFYSGTLNNIKFSNLRDLDRSSLKQFPYWKRLLSFFNIRSLSQLLALLLTLTIHSSTLADVRDPNDPFDFLYNDTGPEVSDSLKTASELVDEARHLLYFDDSRLLEARTKLLLALQKDPTAYQAHMLLAGYYMSHVSHFRLAMKYLKRAEDLFYNKNGNPPYSNFELQDQHANIIYLLAQIRLNLDNYSGALKALDQYTSYGYFGDWLPGTKAWVQMKLGKIDEAINTARVGVVAGAEPGRTLNMLGILLSMHDEPENALKVFKEAVSYELSQGEKGQPATPLNNSAEVYKEAFQDDKAEAMWLRALSFPDGCDHVLASLNLSLFYIDQAKFEAAKRTMDNFESCVAQYPLRNGEEHRVLVNLARGRINLHTGKVNQAIDLLEKTLEDRQWFGKIGTSETDLKSGAMISLAQALRARINHNQLAVYGSFVDRLNTIQQNLKDRFRAWWLLRRARQILAEDSNNLEDIHIRNTDSLLEYPTLGDLLNGFRYSTLSARISKELELDKRPEAKLYYDQYLAEKNLGWWNKSTSLDIIQKTITKARPKYDDLLKLRATLLIMNSLDLDNFEYEQLATRAFKISRAALRNSALKLPVNYAITSAQLAEELSKTAFYLDNSRNRVFKVEGKEENGVYTLIFKNADITVEDVSVKGKNLAELINKFNDTVFTENL